MINNTKIVFILMLISTSLMGQGVNNDSNSSLSPEPSGIANQQAAILHGTVIDDSENELQGASVLIIGTEKGVNTNEDGQFYFDNLLLGEVNIQASIMGYKTQTVSVILQPGLNELSFTLEENIIHLKPVTVNAQKREQQILDVPTAINVVGSDLIEQANIVELGHFSEYIPGLNIIEQGSNRPTFVIRGLTSEEVSPSAQPRVSVFQNNVPINRANGASVALYDMERVEVLRGPQNALFGRSAQIGAIHFISNRPENTTDGYASVAFGNYNQREFRGAINVPVVKDKLFVRAAGFYDFRDGFVENTFGGTLNGKNTLAGRLSVRYLPAKNHQLDLILSYQDDDTPGVAFMSKQFPNTEGDTDIFNYRASLEQGENLYTGKELFDAALYYKYIINEHTYLSTITSFRKTSSGSRWDGDGTAAPALDFRDDAGADQFYQELRYNFSWRSRLNGSAGISYWNEKADQTYWFSPNEQSTAVLFFSPELLILPNGQPLLIPALPDNPELGPIAGMPLPEYHLENNYSVASNQALEAFFDATYQITSKLYFTGGIRTAYENFELSNEAAFVDGEPSTLGLITGNHPNMFFKPTAEQSMDDNSMAVNWQAGLQYRISENTNIFSNYSNGRRPVVLQFTSAGEPEQLPAERVDNIDIGIKSSVYGRAYIDVVAFYQKYKDFQTRAWVADPETGEFNYKTIDGGMATSYGVESSLNVSLLKGIELFGNYAYLHATFDDTNKDGSEQEYGGNTFRLSPRHAFTLGLYAYANLSANFKIFITPSYAYKTHFYFEDANTPGLDQSAYGLLYLNFGIELENPNIILSFFSTNTLNEQFLTSAGNTGSLFGIPTYVPGPPRMYGSRLTWKF